MKPVAPCPHAITLTNAAILEIAHACAASVADCALTAARLRRVRAVLAAEAEIIAASFDVAARTSALMENDAPLLKRDDTGAALSYGITGTPFYLVDPVKETDFMAEASALLAATVTVTIPDWITDEDLAGIHRKANTPAHIDLGALDLLTEAANATATAGAAP